MNHIKRIVAIAVAAILLLTALVGSLAPIFYAAEQIVDAPATGDTSILGPMLIVFGVSAALIVLLVIILALKKKKK